MRNLFFFLIQSISLQINWLTFSIKTQVIVMKCSAYGKMCFWLRMRWEVLLVVLSFSETVIFNFRLESDKTEAQFWETSMKHSRESVILNVNPKTN